MTKRGGHWICWAVIHMKWEGWACRLCVIWSKTNVCGPTTTKHFMLIVARHIPCPVFFSLIKLVYILDLITQVLPVLTNLVYTVLIPFLYPWGSSVRDEREGFNENEQINTSCVKTSQMNRLDTAFFRPLGHEAHLNKGVARLRSKGPGTKDSPLRS